jgi:hypothetical protein
MFNVAVVVCATLMPLSTPVVIAANAILETNRRRSPIFERRTFEPLLLIRLLPLKCHYL